MAENKKDNGIYTHEFKEPFEYENKKYTVINFEFKKLTGNDFLNIESEMGDNSEYLFTSPEINGGFLYRFAARAAGIGSDVILALPAKDYSKITNAARRFLMGLG